MLPNIVLIGFMGSGKSSVGRKLAATLGYRFVDTDELIARHAGKPITQIFAQEGEEAFRLAETKTLKDLVGTFNIVLSTGGGLVLREENRSLLHQIGTIVWLTGEPSILFARATKTKQRPLLLTNNPEQTYHSLYTQRLPIYEQLADITIDCTSFAQEQVAKAVLKGIYQKRKQGIETQRKNVKSEV